MNYQTMLARQIFERTFSFSRSDRVGSWENAPYPLFLSAKQPGMRRTIRESRKQSLRSRRRWFSPRPGIPRPLYIESHSSAHFRWNTTTAKMCCFCCCKKRCPGFVQDSIEICVLLGLSIILLFGGLLCIAINGAWRSESWYYAWFFLGW